MDPPPPPASSAANRLRLMCSYGGHIVPRPRTNSPCYAGGDTRIVGFDPRTVTTLSSFLSHLSSTLSLSLNSSSFALKYQLPHLDLDSLISLTSDEDFHILVDELNRLCSSPSPAPSRIRLFLFPTTPDSVIRHPKREAWFFDALKSAKIMQKEKGRHCLTMMGNNNMEGEPQEYCSAELSRTFLSSGPESMVLETSSSFGSTSSSASFSNLPPIRAHVEDNEAILKDSKVKLTSSDTTPIPSFGDNTVSSVMPHQQSTPSYQDPVVHVSEARVNAESIEVESKIPNISSGVTGMANNTNTDLGYSSFPQFNQVQRSHLQFVQADARFLPLHPSGLLPVPSCQHIYQQQPLPLQHLVYHPNQPYPVYLVPIGEMPLNSLPTTASGQASLNQSASFANFHVDQNPEGGAVSPFAHDFASPNYITDNTATSFVHVPYNRSQPGEMDIHPMQYHQSQTQTISITSRESPKYGNDLDDDLAHAQIYKSQPPPPTLPSKYQTMTKASTALLSEAVSQLHVENLKQQTETSQPL